MSRPVFAVGPATGSPNASMTPAPWVRSLLGVDDQGTQLGGVVGEHAPATPRLGGDDAVDARAAPAAIASATGTAVGAAPSPRDRSPRSAGSVAMAGLSKGVLMCGFLSGLRLENRGYFAGAASGFARI